MLFCRIDDAMGTIFERHAQSKAVSKRVLHFRSSFCRQGHEKMSVLPIIDVTLGKILSFRRRLNQQTAVHKNPLVLSA